MSDLQSALDARFDGCMSELYDIANHGIDTGIHGFIYNDELCDFYDDHESDILEVLDELNLTWNDLNKDVEVNCIEMLKVKAAWVAVENYAFHKVEAHQELATA